MFRVWSGGSSKWWLGLLAALLVVGAGCGSDSGGGSTGSSKTKFNEFLYVTNRGDDVVSEFSINKHTGALSLIGTVTAGFASGASGIAVTPDFDFAYVTNVNIGEVYGFQINSDGTLTPTAQGDIAVNDGVSDPIRVVSDATGAFVYVLNNLGLDSAGQVYAYSIGAGGALTLIPPAEGESNPIATGNDPTSIASVNNLFSRNFLNAVYVTNNVSGTVSEYTINSDGTLKLLGNVDSLGPNTAGAPTDVVIPSPHDAYVSDQGGAVGGVVSHFAVGSDGSLTFISSTATSNTVKGSFPAFIAAAELTRKIFTSNFVSLPLGINNEAAAARTLNANNLSGFKLDPDGDKDLLFTQLTDFSGIPAALSSDVIGRFLYVPNNQNGTVSQYVINGKTGAIKPIGTGSVSTEATSNPNSLPLQAVSALLLGLAR